MYRIFIYIRVPYQVTWNSSIETSNLKANLKISISTELLKRNFQKNMQFPISCWTLSDFRVWQYFIVL